MHFSTYSAYSKYFAWPERNLSEENRNFLRFILKFQSAVWKWFTDIFDLNSNFIRFDHKAIFISKSRFRRTPRFFQIHSDAALEAVLVNSIIVVLFGFSRLGRILWIKNSWLPSWWKLNCDSILKQNVLKKHLEIVRQLAVRKLYFCKYFQIFVKLFPWLIYALMLIPQMKYLFSRYV